jgi:hypothetical protein
VRQYTRTFSTPHHVYLYTHILPHRPVRQYTYVTFQSARVRIRIRVVPVWCRFGIVWHPRCVRVVPVWCRFGIVRHPRCVRVAPVWCRFGAGWYPRCVRVVPVRRPFGAVLCRPWNPFGTILRTYAACLRIIRTHGPASVCDVRTMRAFVYVRTLTCVRTSHTPSGPPGTHYACPRCVRAEKMVCKWSFVRRLLPV